MKHIPIPIALLTLVTLASAEEPAADPKIVAFPGGGRAFVEEKRVELEGIAVYPTRAPIELFVCATGGKEHEAVISVQCVPQDVHFALLILGLRDKSEFPDRKGPAHLGDPAKPVGDRVAIWISWEIEGKKHRVRAEDLLTYGPSEDKRTMPRSGWVFAGSERWEKMDPDTGEKTGETIYMANRDRTLISTLHDPTTVLDNPMTAGGDDRVFHPNFDLLPPRGTKVVVSIEIPDPALLADMKKVEEEADREYQKLIEGKWKEIEEVVPDQKGAEPVPGEGERK